MTSEDQESTTEYRRNGEVVPSMRLVGDEWHMELEVERFIPQETLFSLEAIMRKRSVLWETKGVKWSREEWL